MTRKKPEDLRSHRWFGATDLRSFGHRSRAMQMGYGREDFMGKPVVAIINTWSDLNTCHSHLRTRAEEVKRGVWQAGGFPVELPALSLSEQFVKPTTMLYRNLLAIEVEELLRSHPIDGAVLLGGCDKTTPGDRHGRPLDGPADDLPAGRADDARPFRRQHSRLRLGRVEILGREGSRQHHDRAVERHGGRHRALGRHLHDDGHRRDDDVDRGVARPLSRRALRRSRRPTRRIRAWRRRAAGTSSR